MVSVLDLGAACAIAASPRFPPNDHLGFLSKCVGGVRGETDPFQPKKSGPARAGRGWESPVGRGTLRGRSPPPRSVGMDIAFYIPWALNFLLTVNDVLVRDYREQVSEARCSRRPVLIFVPWALTCCALGLNLPMELAGQPQYSHPNLPPHHLPRTELRQRFAPPAGGHLYLLSAPQLSLALGVIMNDDVMFFF